MAATLREIKEWLNQANKNKATHLIVAVDRYDYNNYPVYVTANEDIHKEIERIDNADMQGIDEIYDMSISIEKQLNEDRAYHT